jgi:chaperone LolA
MNLLRRTAVLAAALLAPLLSPALAAPGDLSSAEAAQLLARMQEHRAKFPSLTADLSEEKTCHLLQKPLVSNGTLAFQAPNKFRRELKGNNPSLMVSNGQKLWIYYPKFKEAELYLLGQRAFFDDAIEALTAGLNFQRVADFYRYTITRDGSGYRMLLTPKSGGLKRIMKELTVQVDESLRVTRTVAVLPKGDQVVTSYRSQKPTALPASTFDYAPPADARVSQPLGK